MTPFTREVELKPLPRRFKVPSMSQYNRDNDPDDHLDTFNVQMDLQTTSLLVKCSVFPATLGDIAHAWFKGPSPRSISSREECQRRFLDQYRALRRQLALPCHLAMMFQKTNELLKDYISRFRYEVNNIEDPSDESVLITISTGFARMQSSMRAFTKPLLKIWENSMNELPRRSSGKRPLARRSPSNGKKRLRALTKTRKGTMEGKLRENARTTRFPSVLEKRR